MSKEMIIEKNVSINKNIMDVWNMKDLDLIKKTTAMMAELVTNTSNKPFSVIDAGWATYSPLLPGDGGWNDDFSKPNDKFKDTHLLGDEIKKLGMSPGLWMRPR